MNIFINGSAVACSDECTVQGMLESIEVPLQGTAVAINDAIVSKSCWSSYTLQEGDVVTLIKATAGG